MPVLPGIGQTQRLAVFDDVGQRHHLGQPRLLVGVGDIDFQRAEVGTEVAQLARRQGLVGKVQHAVAAQRGNDLLKLWWRQRLRQVNAVDGSAQGLVGGFDVHEDLG